MTLTRREFLQQGGVGLLTFTVAGCEKQMTPEDARRADIPFRVLSASDVDAVDKLGDALVPGSAERGLAHYLDHQLGGSPADSMLMIKYLGVDAPYWPFYQGGLASAAAASLAMFGVQIAEIDSTQSRELVGAMAAGSVDGWEGPPPGFFYFVLRADAVDITYGTVQGFDELGIPYQAHIQPPSRWGE
jgi:hypothetical protein